MAEVKLPNPNLHSLTSDRAFHFDMEFNEENGLKYSDVKFVCVGGTPGRMRETCVRAAKAIYGVTINENSEFDTFFESERYSGYKFRGVLCVNHGIGMPSLSIVLHEVFKLLQLAKCTDVTLIRIGTSGGLGVPHGTVVITDKSLDVDMKPLYHTSNFGRAMTLESRTNPTLLADLQTFIESSDFTDRQVVVGNTYCANDFYQGQGRLDGSFCDKTENDKMEFIQRLHKNGVRNIEMESAGVLGMSHHVGIKAVVICATIVDRFQSDLITLPHEELLKAVDAPIKIVVQFMKSKLT